MLKAGRLDRRITLETNTTTRSKSGQEISTWGDAVQVWAGVSYKTANEVFQADQLSALQQVVFTIRYRSGITAAKTQVLHDGQTYNITGVTEIGRKEGLQLIGTAENNG